MITEENKVFVDEDDEGNVIISVNSIRIEISTNNHVTVDTDQPLLLRGNTLKKLDRPGLRGDQVNPVLNALGEKS